MKKIIAIIALALTLSACSDSSGAKKALEGAGYHDIRITGYRMYGCDTGKHGSDTYTTGFAAKGPTNVYVTGVVCKGFWKGSTIRLDD